jgi:hypothetical protein
VQTRFPPNHLNELTGKKALGGFRNAVSISNLRNFPEEANLEV